MTTDFVVKNIENIVMLNSRDGIPKICYFESLGNKEFPRLFMTNKIIIKIIILKTPRNI